MAFKPNREADRGQMESEVVALLRVWRTGERSKRTAVKTKVEVNTLVPGVYRCTHQTVNQELEI